MNDLALAQASADIYAGEEGFERVWAIDGIKAGLRRLEDYDILVFRGSVTAQDWLRDFRAVPVRHRELGYVHEGFLEGMESVYREVLPALDRSRPLAVAGHSLGAARALIFAGLLTADARAPRQLVTFGTPRPAYSQLSRILNDAAFRIVHYRNGSDPVAEVPVYIPVFAPWQKPVADTPLCVAPTEVKDPFAWHHMPLYLEGVRRDTPRA